MKEKTKGSDSREKDSAGKDKYIRVIREKRTAEERIKKATRETRTRQVRTYPSDQGGPGQCMRQS